MGPGDRGMEERIGLGRLAGVGGDAALDYVDCRVHCRAGPSESCGRDECTKTWAQGSVNRERCFRPGRGCCTGTRRLPGACDTRARRHRRRSRHGCRCPAGPTRASNRGRWRSRCGAAGRCACRALRLRSPAAPPRRAVPSRNAPNRSIETPATRQAEAALDPRHLPDRLVGRGRKRGSVAAPDFLPRLVVEQGQFVWMAADHAEHPPGRHQPSASAFCTSRTRSGSSRSRPSAWAEESEEAGLVEFTDRLGRDVTFGDTARGPRFQHRDHRLGPGDKLLGRGHRCGKTEFESAALAMGKFSLIELFCRFSITSQKFLPCVTQIVN